MCILYILYSKKADRYYVGVTNNIQKRLEQHNSGKTKSTKAYVPWILVYSEEYESKSLAMKRESEIKRKKSKKYIKWLIGNRNTG